MPVVDRATERAIVERAQQRGMSQDQIKQAILKFREQSAGTQAQPQQVQPQEQQGPGLLESIAKPFTKAASSLQATVPVLGNVASSGIASLMGRPEQAQDFLKKAGEAANKEYDYGPFGKARPIGFEQDTGKVEKPVQFAKDVIGTGAEIGSYLGPGAVYRTAKAANAAKTALLPMVKGVAKAGAVAGGLQFGGSELQRPESTLGSVATETGKGIIGGAVTAPIFPIAGRATKAIAKPVIEVAEKALSGMPSRAINSILKPLEKQFRFGRNPGQAVVDEGIIANSIGELKQKIAAKSEEIGSQVEGLVKTAQQQGKLVDMEPVFQEMDTILSEAVKTGDQTLVNRIKELKTKVLTEEFGLQKGKVVPLKARGEVVTPSKALEFKRELGKAAKWTGQAFDAQANKARVRIYDVLDKEIDKLSPEIASLNDRWGGMIGADESLRRTMNIKQRQQMISFGDIVGSGVGFGVGGVTGLGFWPLARRAFESTFFKTRVAQILNKFIPERQAENVLNSLAKATPEQAKAIFASIPVGAKNQIISELKSSVEQGGENALKKSSDSISELGKPIFPLAQKEMTANQLQSEITKRIEKFRKESGLLAEREGAGVTMRPVKDARGNVEFMAKDFSLNKAKGRMKAQADDAKRYAAKQLYDSDPEFKALVDKLESMPQPDMSGLPPELMGLSAGITPEVDDEGNVKGVKYDPKMGLMGLAGMTVGKKAPGLIKNLIKNEDKNLVVLHNLSETKLGHSNKLGGLPVPSIAISRKEFPLEGFGDITLVGDKSLIDPSIKSNKVYNADVYSKRYPAVGYDISNVNPINKLLENTMGYFTGTDFPSWARSSGDRIISEIKDRGLDGLNNFAVKEAFAKKIGLPKDSTYYKINDISYEMPDEFSAFKESLFDQLNPKGRIFKGFTYSGNRRYVDETLDNVVKEMKGSVRNKEGFSYGVPSLRASRAKSFRNIDAIKKMRGNIIPKDKMDVIKESFNKEWESLIQKHGVNDQQDFITNLSDYMSGKIPFSKLNEYPSTKGIEMKDFIDFTNRLIEAPTEYFEAKPQRAVSLSEFKAAIVPETISKKSEDILSGKGVHVVKYNSKVPGDRAKKIKEYAEKYGLVFGLAPLLGRKKDVPENQ